MQGAIVASSWKIVTVKRLKIAGVTGLRNRYAALIDRILHPVMYEDRSGQKQNHESQADKIARLGLDRNRLTKSEARNHGSRIKS